MAVKTITPIKMELNTMSSALNFTAPTAVADGFSIPFAQQDMKTVILVQNSGSGAGTLTIKKGNGLQGVADTEAFSLGASEIKSITVESGRFKHVSGPGKGTMIAIPSSTDIKIAVIVLP